MVSDQEKAIAIVSKRQSFVGGMKSMKENIADAVAEGIALGRKEALENIGFGSREDRAA